MSGRTSRRARTAPRITAEAKVAAIRPLTTAETSAYAQRIRSGGEALAASFRADVLSAGLPLPKGAGAGFDWTGGVVWQLPVAVKQAVDSRFLFEALGTPGPEAETARAVIRAAAVDLARSVPDALRRMAAEIEVHVQRAEERSGRSGGSQPAPAQRRIVLVGG